jgi:hypothetical protein
MARRGLAAAPGVPAGPQAGQLGVAETREDRRRCAGHGGADHRSKENGRNPCGKEARLIIYGANDSQERARTKTQISIAA